MDMEERIRQALFNAEWAREEGDYESAEEFEALAEYYRQLLKKEADYRLFLESEAG